MIAIITSNQNKYTNILKLAKLQYTIQLPKENLQEIQSLDWNEVLGCKIQQAYKLMNMPCIIDDAGLTLDQYPAFPGILTKFVLKSLQISGLKDLISVSQNYGATMKCGIAFQDSNMAPKFFWGEVHGMLDFSRKNIVTKGQPGILSSIFVPNEGSFPTELHRLRAFKQFETFWEENHGRI